MRTVFRLTSGFLQEVKRDLGRPHRFAAERVGFISVRAASTRTTLLLLAEGYHQVADNDYIDDATVGAMMGQEAIRKALNIALLQSVGMFHVHVHEHEGTPNFSHTDLHEQAKFVPDFFKVHRRTPHGAIVLSHDKAAGRVWIAPEAILEISEINTIGPRILIDMAQARRSGRLIT